MDEKSLSHTGWNCNRAQVVLLVAVQMRRGGGAAGSIDLLVCP